MITVSEQNKNAGQDADHSVSQDLKERMKQVGLDIDNTENAGVYVQADDSSLQSDVSDSSEGDVVILDIRDALKKYDWLKDYWWKAVKADKDEYTKYCDENLGGGYFIWVKAGAKVNFPIQSCMMIKEDNFKQVVHNVVIVEEGASVNILSGCLTHENAHTAEHIGISEFYIKKNAYLNFTMVHEWNDKSFVRPRSAAIVDDDAHFVSNYVVLNDVGDIQMYPATYLRGKNSKATLTSLLYGKGKSILDVGGMVEATGEGSSGDIVSRAIANDNSEIHARGRIIGANENSRAHLECQGLLLSNDALMNAVPELVGKNEGTDLSHEAAVGKIAEEELIYLMSRGLTEEEATAVIVRGFLDIKILGLPKDFEDKVQALIEKVGEEGY